MMDNKIVTDDYTLLYTIEENRVSYTLEIFNENTYFVSMYDELHGIPIGSAGNNPLSCSVKYPPKPASFISSILKLSIEALLITYGNTPNDSK